MKEFLSTYKKGGIAVYLPQGDYGIRFQPEPPYKYKKGHPCHDCPYTLKTSVPSCMFPDRKDGSCFWYDLKKQKKPKVPDSERQLAVEKIFAFIEVLEAVKRRKGYIKKNKDIQTDSKGGDDIYDCK